MGVPTNTVQQDGLAEVTGDQYNTYTQGCAGLAGLSGFGTGGLQNFIGVEGMVVYVPGLASIADGGQGDFYWNALGSANDGINNIQPNGAALGCWTRVPYVISGSTGPVNFVNAVNFASGGNVASAATTPIGAAPGNYITITGTTAITAFDTVQAGAWRAVKFAGALTLTYNATSLILPTAANIVTAAGDTAIFVSLGSGNWICLSYQRESGMALVSSTALKTIVTQTFTSPGTYLPSPGMAYCFIKAIGGGAGGGGCTAASSNSGGGAGGSAGTYAECFATAAQIGASQAITIGTGGVGGLAGANTGSNGTATSVGALISCPGGNGGTGCTASTSAALIGGGPSGSAATISGVTSLLNLQGQSGDNGIVLSGTQVSSGRGGSGLLGVGGSQAVNNNLVGSAGAGFGAGGSGAVTQNASTNLAGGNGTGGYVEIIEYCTQ